MKSIAAIALIVVAFIGFLLMWFESDRRALNNVGISSFLNLIIAMILFAVCTLEKNVLHMPSTWNTPIRMFATMLFLSFINDALCACDEFLSVEPVGSTTGSMVRLSQAGSFIVLLPALICFCAVYCIPRNGWASVSFAQLGTAKGAVLACVAALAVVGQVIDWTNKDNCSFLRSDGASFRAWNGTLVLEAIVLFCAMIYGDKPAEDLGVFLMLQWFYFMAPIMDGAGRDAVGQYWSSGGKERAEKLVLFLAAIACSVAVILAGHANKRTAAPPVQKAASILQSVLLFVSLVGAILVFIRGSTSNVGRSDEQMRYYCAVFGMLLPGLNLADLKLLQSGAAHVASLAITPVFAMEQWIQVLSSTSTLRAGHILLLLVAILTPAAQHLYDEPPSSSAVFAAGNESDKKDGVRVKLRGIFFILFASAAAFSYVEIATYPLWGVFCALSLLFLLQRSADVERLIYFVLLYIAVSPDIWPISPLIIGGTINSSHLFLLVVAAAYIVLYSWYSPDAHFDILQEGSPSSTPTEEPRTANQEMAQRHPFEPAVAVPMPAMAKDSKSHPPVQTQFRMQHSET